MSIYTTYDLEQLVGILHTDKETDDFLNNPQKGAFAKAVTGDEKREVHPKALTAEETERARKYLISQCEALKLHLTP